MRRTAHRNAFAATLRLSGEDVTYWPTGSEGQGLRAVRGQTTFREEPTERGARIVRSTDFLFDPAAFWEKVGRWPEEGDKVTEAPPSEIPGLEPTTYRVVSINGEPAYRLEETYSILRVHAQELWVD